jgi:hypothetical protein
MSIQLRPSDKDPCPSSGLLQRVAGDAAAVSFARHATTMFFLHFVGDASLSPTRFAEGRNY